jgi:hypothetical protein
MPTESTEKGRRGIAGVVGFGNPTPLVQATVTASYPAAALLQTTSNDPIGVRCPFCAPFGRRPTGLRD